MAAVVTTRPRVFKLGSATLADIDEDMTVDEIRKAYATAHPSLTNASVTGPVQEGDKDVYTFKAAVATKG